mgnify:CR=1 FL=1
MSDADAELERLLTGIGQTVVTKIQNLTREEKHLILHWKNNQGMALSFNLTLTLRETSDTRTILAVIDEAQKELHRRGLNRAA